MKRVVQAQTTDQSDLKSRVFSFLDEYIFDNFENGLAAVVAENVPGYDASWANEKASLDNPAELKLIRHRNDYLDATIAGLFALRRRSDLNE